MTVSNAGWRAYMKLSDLGPDIKSAKDLQDKLNLLTPEELERAATLIREGWGGSLEELILAAKELS